MLPRVRWLCMILGVCFLGVPAWAGERASERGEFPGTDEIGWARWLEGFGEFDDERIAEVLGKIREQFEGEYVVDLVPLKQTAKVLATVLRGSDETQRYAEWLDAQRRGWPEEFEFRLLRPAAVPVAEEFTGVAPSVAGLGLDWRAEVEGFIEPRGANHFVPRLKPIFESMRVPVELVWVAEVESSFNPRAVSPVGAAGLYQLMPATARQYGLILEPDDDRFHPEKNARAAARHMLYLGRQFEDWHLAMAAYNAGHNRVRRLLTKHDARSFEEIAIYLPLETQMFVPRVDAVLALREGVSLARLSSRLP
jgi:membrane-bound lytic murein transglycosylase D